MDVVTKESGSQGVEMMKRGSTFYLPLKGESINTKTADTKGTGYHNYKAMETSPANFREFQNLIHGSFNWQSLVPFSDFPPLLLHLSHSYVEDR